MEYYQVHPCTVNSKGCKHGHSGVLFKSDYIITSAKDLLLSLSPEERQKITQTLSKNQIPDNQTIEALPSFLVTIKHQDKLVQIETKVKLIFNCRTSRKALNSILSRLKNDCNLDSDEIGIVFSSFLILGMYEGKHETKTEILGTILMQLGQRAKYSKMDPVYTLSSLYGDNSFFGTYNTGIISNIIDESILIISAPLVQGCEGAGVFNNKDKLLGIIVASFFYLDKDNVTLTLAVQIDDIVNELIQLNQGVKMEFVPLKKFPQKQLQKGENCVALINLPSSWGTGTFIRVKEEKFLITCSHVLSGSPITVYWKHGKYKPKIIYKNPKFNKAYDVALLTVPNNLPDECVAPLARDQPLTGMKVYNVGFPLIASFAKKKFSPFIYDGTVSRYGTGFLCTDTIVQAGQSGGPLFDAEWRLLGVCVCNIRSDIDKKLLPKINMAVPIYDILECIEEFAMTGDKRKLGPLSAPETIQTKWKLDVPVFKAKL